MEPSAKHLWELRGGRHWLALKAPCNKLDVTRKGLTFFVDTAIPKHESALLVTIKNTVLPAVAPELVLAWEECPLTPTRAETKLHLMPIMESSTSKQWAIFWFNDPFFYGRQVDHQTAHFFLTSYKTPLSLVSCLIWLKNNPNTIAKLN